MPRRVHSKPAKKLRKLWSKQRARRAKERAANKFALTYARLLPKGDRTDPEAAK